MENIHLIKKAFKLSIIDKINLLLSISKDFFIIFKLHQLFTNTSYFILVDCSCSIRKTPKYVTKCEDAFKKFICINVLLL